MRAASKARVCGWLLGTTAPLLFVAAFFTYYGQLNRNPESDTYGTIYTAVAVVQKHTILLNSYVPYFVQHGAGQQPYMLNFGPDGQHVENATPTAATALALPVVSVLSAAGVKASDWNAWMEAGMFSAALFTAASVAVMFVLLTRLTTRRRAALIAVTYGWGTLEWGISGQALWEHTGATFALTVALYGFVTQRPLLAGFALAGMVACRPSTLVIAALLLPVVGKGVSSWARFLAGLAPFALPILLYNAIVLGSPFHLYHNSHTSSALDYGSGHALQGVPGLLVSPGRGLLLYSPVVLFVVLGIARGWRRALYVWAALAVAGYTFVIGNGDQWWGGESFGARKLTDILPLLAVLLVPAIDAIVRTRWLALYGGLLAWSVFVELLEASAQPPDLWFNGPHPHDLQKTSTWWSFSDNEIVTMIHTPNVWFRMLLMSLIAACGFVFGRLAATSLRSLRRPEPA